MDSKNRHELNPRVSADCVIFGFDLNQIKVLLIEREAINGVEQSMALPGDLIFEGENLDTAASRVLYELTGLDEGVEIALKSLLYAVDGPGDFALLATA